MIRNQLNLDPMWNFFVENDDFALRDKILLRQNLTNTTVVSFYDGSGMKWFDFVHPNKLICVS